MEKEKIEELAIDYMKRKGFMHIDLSLGEDGNRNPYSLSDPTRMGPWLLVDFLTRLLSCEGTLLASGSGDCTVMLWDVTSSTKATKMVERNLYFHLGHFQKAKKKKR